MNIFKKLIEKLKKKDEKEPESWFNDKSNNYDPATGTPNGEAYIIPDSIVIGLSKSNQSS